MSKKGTTDNRGIKRRFLQQAHPIPPSPTTTHQQSSKSSGNLGNLTKNSAAANTPTNTESNNKSKGKPKSLQADKSIEELEAILERRWGTAQTTIQSGSKRGGGDDNADFVLNFGNDDDYEHADGSEVGSKKKNVGGGNLMKGAAVFRKSNRVMDPWAREEGIYDKYDDSDIVGGDIETVEITKKKRGDDDGSEGRYDRQDAMLNRVRSNQERLQSTKRRDDGGRKNEGRSDRGGVSRDEPRPVERRESLSKSSLTVSSLSGGIFSDRPTNAGRPNGQDGRSRGDDSQKDDKTTKRPKRKEPQLQPLLDDDGNAMFLTLEQAEKIVQSILSSSASSAEDTITDGAGDSTPDDGNNYQWEDIGITDSTLLSNLQSSVMSCPSPLAVQDKACPPIVAGDDVLISTHTGSGKTLAFMAPIAQNLLSAAGDNNNSNGGSSFPRAIIVAPGRELASQIVSVAQTLFAGTGLTVSMAIGGTPYTRNVERLRKRKPDVVVGTPGRIAELVIGRPGDKGGKLKISGLQTVVLDEFDALLQYDAHKEPTMAIMQAMDRQHGQSLQRVLCSATASDMRGSLMEEYLRSGYVHASVDDSDLLVTSGVETKTKGGVVTTSARVSRTTIHGTLHVPHRRLQLEAVRKILNTEPLPQQALIFVDSPRRVDIVIEKLAQMDIVAAPLHGGGGKGDRAEVNKALREGFVGIVVATEMAARGIDAPFLTHVINLDLPTDASHYAHRAGRCGRGGRPGVAVSITCDVRERGVPKRFAEELGIAMYNVEAREGKLRIVE